MIVLYIFLAIAILIALIFIKKILELKKGKALADAQLAGMKINKLSAPGSVKTLSVLPLIDYYTDHPNLKTEPGVSYLLQADDTKILLDVCFTKKDIVFFNHTRTIKQRYLFKKHVYCEGIG